MFEFGTCNHMVRFTILGDGIEDPGFHIFYPGCDGVCMICIDTYIHFVCLVAMSSSFESSRIDPQCIPSGYAVYWMSWIHGV
jgi:hypothetical protein